MGRWIHIPYLHSGRSAAPDYPVVPGGTPHAYSGNNFYTNGTILVWDIVSDFGAYVRITASGANGWPVRVRLRRNGGVVWDSGVRASTQYYAAPAQRAGVAIAGPQVTSHAIGINQGDALRVEMEQPLLNHVFHGNAYFDARVDNRGYRVEAVDGEFVLVDAGEYFGPVSTGAIGQTASWAISPLT